MIYACAFRFYISVCVWWVWALAVSVFVCFFFFILLIIRFFFSSSVYSLICVFFVCCCCFVLTYFLSLVVALKPIMIRGRERRSCSEQPQQIHTQCAYSFRKLNVIIKESMKYYALQVEHAPKNNIQLRWYKYIILEWWRHSMIQIPTTKMYRHQSSNQIVLESVWVPLCFSFFLSVVWICACMCYCVFVRCGKNF